MFAGTRPGEPTGPNFCSALRRSPAYPTCDTGVGSRSRLRCGRLLAYCLRRMSVSGVVAPPFVGRARELGALAAALDHAPQGHTRVLALTGEPGIGKPRTVEGLV